VKLVAALNDSLRHLESLEREPSSGRKSIVKGPWLDSQTIGRSFQSEDLESYVGSVSRCIQWGQELLMILLHGMVFHSPASLSLRTRAPVPKHF
jgi:hypothetical protein